MGDLHDSSSIRRRRVDISILDDPVLRLHDATRRPPGSRPVPLCILGGKLMSHHPTKQGGFTLIEMIVVVAIIAALAAILVPIVSSELADSEQTKALADCQRIAAAITQYIKDTRLFPTGPL